MCRIFLSAVLKPSEILLMNITHIPFQFGKHKNLFTFDI